MELRDFIVTPIILSIVYFIAYVVRPYVTDDVSRRYFIPGLSMRIIGGIAMGLVYQFYYGGGDTFNYHTYGSRIVWESFIDNPSNLLRFVFGSNASETGIYMYSSRMTFFHDPNSYFVVRIASLFDVLTFSSYSGTAVLFSVFSFAGMWMLFQTFYKQYPHLHFGLAIAVFFIPSVFFWGSGILKDTLILGCIGIATAKFYQLLIERRLRIGSVLVLVGSLYLIYKVRIFVLQAYLPSIALWVLASNYSSIRSVALRMSVIPVAAALLSVSTYYAVVKVAEDDKKYSVSNIVKTSKVTAYDIGFYTGRGAGSTYSLDIPDWTPVGLLQVAPAAVNVSLFRPYLWEVRNPLMLMSSVESTLLMIFTLYILMRNFRVFLSSLTNYNIAFCLVFSIAFAFAIGVSTFNFGTLTRYRIPSLPFYAIALVIMNDYSKNRRKFSELEITE